MNRALVLSAAVIALATGGTATSAAPFQVNFVSAGVTPGDPGSPITWTHSTNGAAYQNSSVLGVFGPDADTIDNIPPTRFDSYLGMDPVGPTDGGDPSITGDGYNTNTNLGTTGPQVGFTSSGGNGQVQGAWYSNSFIASGPGDRVFLLQLTLRPGSSDPTTAGLFINIRDTPDNSGSGALGPVKLGTANLSNNGGAWAHRYFLDYIKTTVSGVNSTFNGGARYQFFLVQGWPAPSTTGIAALAGLAALRRRRP